MKSVLLYGAEAWRMSKTTRKRIQKVVNQCLRSILGIQWMMDKASNKDLWERTNQVQTRDIHSKENMGMAWPHLEKPKQQHYNTGLDAKLSGQQKEGEAKTPAT